MIYHVSYAREPRNCLFIDMVMNLYSIMQTHVLSCKGCVCGGYIPHLSQLAIEVSIAGTVCTTHMRLHSNRDNCAGGVFLTGHAHCGSWSSIDSTDGRTDASEQSSGCLVSQRVGSIVGTTCQLGQVMVSVQIHDSQTTAMWIRALNMQPLFSFCLVS